MALRYPQQSYAVYGNSQWPDDVKPEYNEDDESSILDDKVLDPSSPTEMTAAQDSRRHSMVKLEEDFPTTAHMWHDRPHGHMSQMRHYSQPNVHLTNSAAHSIGRINDSNYDSGYGPSQAWPMAAHSESNTPTPMYARVPDGFGQPVQYPSASVNFPHYQPQDPASAVSMSPQSSQGGWGSTASSDTTEPRTDLRSPRFRPMSPMTVLRSDGIRKKNARFEIPKERNLANIDALIMQSTDEAEKKELKQQKRLLRNRQAALDSRQRKKTHTEKLEQEKKMFTSQRSELEESLHHLQNKYNHEREQWLQDREQYENFIQNLRYERDEAIRTKTLETAELRRMNNALKDVVRDMERQQNTRGFSASSETFNGDFSSFGNLDIEDNWDDEFSLINSEDLKMEGESPRREATPRPAAVPDTNSLLGSKQDSGFSWNTFYMCLLFGAFIASNTESKDPSTTSTAAPALPANIPALSEDYRAEAGNVLKAVLASAPESAHELLPSHSSLSSHHIAATIIDSDFSRMTHQNNYHPSGTSSLEALHTTLTTPTRQQRAAAAFSLSAASYNHITNPDGVFDDDDDEVVEVRGPTRLQQLYAAMQAEHDGLDKMSGMSGKARERSVVLDRVPEKVLRDFREMVGLNEAMQQQEKGKAKGGRLD